MLAFDVLLVGEAPTHPAVIDAFPDPLIETTTVSGIEDAFEYVDADAPDCIVSDYALPESDGLELLSEVRNADRTVPFVLYTADGDETVAQAAIDADVTAYVPRTDDPDPESLVERVVEYARQRHVAGTIDEPDPTAANLRLSELAMDEAPVGITIADPTEPDEPLIYVNEAFEQLTGYDEYEILGRNCRFLQGDDTDPASIESIRRAIDDRRPFSVELRNYRKDGEPFWNQLHIAPVLDDAGELTHFLGFQTDVTERKEIELRARRQAETMLADRRTRERLLARLDGLVQRVTAATVESTSRSEIEARVCDAIVETNDYEAAWFGTRQITSDRIVANTQADCGVADDISIATDSGGPVDTALRTGTVATAEATSLSAGSPHLGFVPSDGGVAVIPLRYRDADYGVLVVYTSRSRMLDEHEIAVLEALGRVIATGSNALQNQRLLTTDEYIQLVFAGGPPAPVLVELAAEADCELTYKGAVSRDHDRFILSVLATGVTAEELRAAADRLDDTPTVTPISAYDDGCLVEIVPTAPSLVQLILDHNGSLRALSADGDGSEIRIELPQTANPNAVVESILSTYGGLSFVSRTRRERERHSMTEFAETLRSELTDRQFEALQRAYVNDYFEWPRPVSGQDIAESMGIARSTFHQHLRAAHSKIMDELFEEFQPLRPR
jgi:PAS domain S-box-containing protein